MQQMVSKAHFKAHILELLREVEKTKQPLVVTHDGKPVIEVNSYKGKEPLNDEAILKSLRGTLVYYEDPNEPVGLEDWEALK